jgi:hypothetical protein
MKRTILSIILFFYSLATLYSQKIFFQSKQSFTENELKNFYSSVAITGNMVLFNANDYKLYAYNLQSGNQLWVTRTGYKTNRPVFVHNNRVYAGYYEDRSENTAILDAGTGTRLKILPIGPLDTKPHVANGILYATAIYDGGCVFAYNIEADSMDWYKFIAHGVSTQPHYGEKEIWANAEADNWFRMDYNGRLLDTSCKEKADMFVSDIPCINVFSRFTHDAKQLTNARVEKLFDGNDIDEIQYYYTAKNSFLLNNEDLVILGDKAKTKARLSIPSLSDSLLESDGGIKRILKADDKKIWLLYNNWFVMLDHTNKKIEQQVDLSAWQPHHAVLDGERLWVISQKDGVLYGITDLAAR